MKKLTRFIKTNMYNCTLRAQSYSVQLSVPQESGHGSYLQLLLLTVRNLLAWHVLYHCKDS